MDTSDPIVLYTTNIPSEAELIKNLLRGEGVKCELDSENQGSLAGILDIRVLVRAADGDKARRVLASHGGHHKEHSWKAEGV